MVRPSGRTHADDPCNGFGAGRVIWCHVISCHIIIIWHNYIYLLQENLLRWDKWVGCSTQAADVSADVLRRALACPSGPLRATQPVSSGKGAPRVGTPGGTCSGTRAARWVTKRPIVQVWTLTLTGCVRQDLGSHRVGDSLKHHQECWCSKAQAVAQEEE